MSVAFVREESAEAAQEVTLPERPISSHPNLVTRSGFQTLEQAVADSLKALRAAQLIEDANERRRPLELASRHARYFSERLASAVLRPEPTSVEVVAFGHRVTIIRDDGRRGLGRCELGPVWQHRMHDDREAAGQSDLGLAHR
jgi:hypothetical protein